LGLNPNAGISHLNTQLIAGVIARRNTNVSLSGGKLHRVVYQIPKDLLKSRWICSQIDLLSGEIEPKSQLLSFNLCLTNFQRILQQRMSINDLKIELDLAFADTREIKQVIDEPGLQLHVAADHLQRVVNILRQGLLTIERDAVRQRRRKRCAQLVAEHREKLVFCEIRTGLFLQLFVRFLQFRCERLRLLEQIFCSRVCFDSMEHNANAFRQLIEKSLVRGIEALERREFHDRFHFSLEQDRQHDDLNWT